MKIIYRCAYEFVIFLDGRDGVRSVYSEKGIDVFQYGFWINYDFEFTQGSDAKYWIPPSKIMYISKDKQ